MSYTWAVIYSIALLLGGATLSTLAVALCVAAANGDDVDYIGEDDRC